MKKLLVIYQKMTLGGSTTSLLSFLDCIDRSLYEIDLILSGDAGEMLDKIPADVHRLPAAIPPSSKITKLIRSLFHKEFYRLLFYRLFRTKKRYTITQLNAYNAVSYARKLPEEYDVAVSYVEFFPNAYLLSDCVKAKRKIAWIHTDYAASGLDVRIDAPYFKKADKIVLVSEACRRSFCDVFPTLAPKAAAVENMLSRSLLQSRAAEYTVDRHGDHVHFLTVCRIDIRTKGLDRLVRIAARLKAEGHRFTWTVVGNGEMAKFTRLIDESGVSDCVLAVGAASNPYPYFSAADCFVLPSRYEGKPMVIPEAQMLTLPCIVTAYASAAEQIRDGVDGIIAENGTDALTDAIRSVLTDPSRLKAFARSLAGKPFDYKTTIETIHKDILG